MSEGTRRLRSQEWFQSPDDVAMTALYIERYMNWGSPARSCSPAVR